MGGSLSRAPGNSVSLAQATPGGAAGRWRRDRPGCSPPGAGVMTESKLSSWDSGMLVAVRKHQ